AQRGINQGQKPRVHAMTILRFLPRRLELESFPAGMTDNHIVILFLAPYNFIRAGTATRSASLFRTVAGDATCWILAGGLSTPDHRDSKGDDDALHKPERRHG